MLLDLRMPFRGADAVSAGLVTPKVLRGPRFRRLFTGIYVAAGVEVGLALRSRAAHLLADGHGVLGGWSAAELLGASCGPQDAPAEIVMPAGARQSRPGLRVRHDVLLPGETARVGGIVVTSALRTAFDLARRAPVVEAVVAVDALTHAFGFAPAELITFGYAHLGARGSAQLLDVVRSSNPLAESPMETRIRIAIGSAGLPLPVLQHAVGPYRLDMAYPAIRLGMEYDGGEHLKPERARRDLARQAWLSSAGWEILRFRAYDVLHRPAVVAAQVRRMIAARAR